MSVTPTLSRPVRHEALRIAGRRMECERQLEVHYPYTGELVGSVAKATVADVREAFRAAASYRPSLSRYQRQSILRDTAARLVARRDEISELITLEAGISKKDSHYEVGRACDVFNLAAQLAIVDDGEIFSCDITPQGKQRKIFTLRQPLTAISAITPFNHPLNQVAHKIAPSVASNNCMVLKPSEKTPFSALLLADVLYEAGLPGPMFSVLTGDPEEIGDEMIRNEWAELVTFTGSVRVGKYIAGQAGYRRTVLELGGNDPLIVLEDADLHRAAELAVAGATKNSGQRCTAVKRILVLDSVANAFAERVLERARALRWGDPMDPATDIGTVIDQGAALSIERRVEAAVAAGARLLFGNERNGASYSPTVLDQVPPACELVREETFGPVMPIIRCRDLDEVIEVSNGTAFGLSSGVCSDRLDHITRLVEELRVGTVNVWEVPGYRIELSPFGGIKDSGLGYKEGVLEAMKSFTNVKTWSLPWP
jgi:putative phosphonoacetaldehyde dehydrogenase